MLSRVLCRTQAAARRSLASLGLALVLAGCGGGGAGEPAAPASQAAPLATTPTPTPAPQPDPATWLSCPSVVVTTQGQPVTLACERLIADLVMASQWRVASAPAGFSVPEAGGLSLSFTATHVGEHRFVLSTSSGGVERLSTIILHVDPPPNAAPTLSCPTALSTVTSEEVVVTCTAADDGRPAGSTLRSEWRVVSAPETVALAGSIPTSARFTPKTAGAYQLRLTVTDGELSTSADVAVTVKLPPNQAPSLTCPATLSGTTLQDVAVSCSASDDGQPAPSALKPRWTVVSSPAPFTLTGQESFNARMVAASPGNYRLRLSVSDGALSSETEVVVVVALPPNQAPALTCPAAVNAVAQQPVAITCAATDDGQPQGKSLTASWSVVSAPVSPTLTGADSLGLRFTPAQAGVYRLKLNVSDSALSASSEVVVTVDPPPNQAPAVNCPATLTGTTQQEVAITCTATDDGQPQGQALVPAWTVLSGPAPVALSNASALTTRFTPTAAGTYRLKLGVSDSKLAGSAEVSVTVALPPNKAPAVNCPANLNGTTQQEVVMGCSATDDGQPLGSTLAPSWTWVSGPANPTLTGAQTLSPRFVPTVAGTYRFKLNVSDSSLASSAEVSVQVALPPNQAPSVNCPAALTGVTQQEVAITCTAADDGQPLGKTLTPAWTFVSGPAAPALTNLGSLSTRFTPSAPGTYRLKLTVSDSLLSNAADVVVTVAPPPNKAPEVSCPTTLNGTTQQEVTVTCTVTDDAQPLGATLQPAWSVVAGPSTPVLAGGGSLSARFTPQLAGTYRLKLSVSDTQLAGASEVTVNVSLPPNKAPVVNCPSTLNATTLQEVAIACTATDDSQPSGVSLQQAWTVVSGPEVPSLSGAGGLVTRFTPKLAGTYRLKLSVSDSLLSAASEVLVNVALPPNEAPLISCPATQTGTTRQEVSITCTATDDGQPLGKALVPSWTIVSSPAPVTLAAAGTLATRFTPTVPGSYRLRLNVSDTQLAATTDVVVTVSLPPNQAPVVNCPETVSGHTGQEIAVTCTAVDDGQPEGKTLASTWSVASAPATPTLSGAQSLVVRFTPSQVGTYRLKLAVNDTLLTGTAETVVNVSLPPQQAPSVSCPSSLDGLTGQAAKIQCSAATNGGAPGRPLVYRWSVVSSPQAVALTPANAASTEFLPTVAGLYKLQLSVIDGAFTTTADVNFTVNLPPNKAPVLNCPSTLVGTTQQELSITCTSSDDGQPLGVALQPSWSVLASPGAAPSLVGAGTQAVRFTPTAVGTYRLRLTVSDTVLSSFADVTITVNLPPNEAPVVSCPATVTGTTQQEVTIACTTTDDGQPIGKTLSSSWSLVSSPGASPVLTGGTSNTVKFTPSAAGTYRLRLSVSDTALSGVADVVVTVALPPNKAPVVTCPATLTGTTQQEVSIGCTSTDDGQPAGKALVPTWSVVSAPAAAPTLLGATSNNVRFTPTVPGTYRLKLQVSDTLLVGAAEVVVTVALPPNTAPVVSCPASLTGTTQLEVAITCTSTDDGQPAGQLLAPRWTVVSAPGTPPALLGASTHAVRFTPLVAGSYRLKLDVGDSQLTGSAEVVVTVALPPNKAPVVVCPATQTGTAQREVVISCTSTDDGQPSGASLTPSWSVVAAPGTSPALSGAGSHSIRFTPVTAGTYRLKLSVSDSLLSGSAEVVVTVALPPNQAPVVTCPATQTGTTQQEVAITCTSTDDGQPAGAVLTSAWSVVSAPGTAPTLVDAATKTVRFTPTVAGTYRLRLSVSDSSLAGTAEVVVNVSLPPNKAPVVTCPAAMTGTSQQEVAITCTVTDDGQPLGASLAPAWSVVAAPTSTALGGANTLTTTFTPAAAGTYRLKLNVSDSVLVGTAEVTVTVSLPPNRAPAVVCPAAVSATARQEVVLTCSATDDGQPAGAGLSASWTVKSAPEAVSLIGGSTFSVRFVPTVAGTYVLRANVTDSQLSSASEVTVTVAAPVNQAPRLTCPAAISGRVQQEVAVSCTVTDDGEPHGSAVTSSWSWISGPASPTLTPVTGPNTRFLPTVAGTYRLQFRATDGQLSSTAEVSIVVDPPDNQAPVVTCPSTQDGLAGHDVVISCTSTDDGLPSGSSLTSQWTVVSGPGSLTLQNAQSMGVRFRPSVTGAYLLRLTVGDSDKTTVTEVAVNITDPPNQAPRLVCPTSVSGTVNTRIGLSCVVSDDALPAGSTLSHAWTLVSGPGTATWADELTAAAGFTPSAVGTYTVRLTVSDGPLTSTADVSVQVTPPPNQAPTVNCPATVKTRVNRNVEVVCTASDDGLPAGSTLSLSWSWSGTQGSASLTPTAGQVRFVPDTAGTHKLRLTASDGLEQTFREIDVQVLPAVTWRIQTLGASIVQGVDGQQSFRYRLWKKLLDAGADIDMVGSVNFTHGGPPVYPDHLGKVFDRDHEGHAGWTSQMVGSSLASWMSTYVPDVSLIHVGSNDLMGSGAAGIDNVLVGLNATVSALRARNPDVRIYVAMLIPIDPDHPQWPVANLPRTAAVLASPQNVVALNARLVSWAAGLSTSRSPIKLVDQWTNYNGRTDSFDGLHPNTSGEEKMAQRFYDAIIDDL